MGVCNCSMFCCTLLYVHSSIAIIFMGKRELIALLNLSSWCLVMVERLFLAVPRGCLRFVIVVFPDHSLTILDGDVPRSTSYGVYISQLICFARASSYVGDFNTRYKLLTQKLLKQGYRYHKLRKTFSKFYRRYYDLISKFQVGLKSLLRQGLSEPDFYGDLVYKLKKILALIIFQSSSLK